MWSQSAEIVRPGTKRGVITAPTDHASDFSLFSCTLPRDAWWKERSPESDWKFGATPAARQFAWRVAGSGPFCSSSLSHGSVAKLKKVLVGLKISVIAGARMAR